MTAARFPLAGVLRVRRILEQRAHGEAARTRAKAATAADHAADLDAELDSRSVLPADRGVTVAATLVARRSLAEDAALAHGLAAAARATADASAAELATARQRAATVERLEERWRADRAAARSRAEVTAADELATSRHARAAACRRPTGDER
jgi:flagellar FliJ protein